MRLTRLVTVLLGTASVCAWQVASVQAADLVVTPPGTIVQDTQLPAVSGVNGKWEFDSGLIYGGAGIRAAGSLSAPLGDRFGVQGDVMGTWSAGNGPVGGLALHVFTRDPSKYLLGLTGGVVVSQQAKLGAFGPEGELYLDRFSLQGWAGVAGIDFVDPAFTDKIGGFAIGDVSYYPDDNVRIGVGGSYLLGDLSLHTDVEYQFSGIGGAPMSLTGDARLHAGGNFSLTVGLKGYFGGSNDKSLIDRHRQDDPPNRVLGLYASAGSQIHGQGQGGGACEPSFTTEPHVNTDCVPSDPEAFNDFCQANDYTSYDAQYGECIGYNPGT